MENVGSLSSPSKDDEDFVDISGNVSNALVVPPDYMGEKPEKGHLIFDADFESGNLGKVVCVWDSEFDFVHSSRHVQ